MTTSTDGMSKPLLATSVATCLPAFLRGSGIKVQTARGVQVKTRLRLNKPGRQPGRAYQDTALPGLELVQCAKPLGLTHLPVDGYRPKPEVAEHQGDLPRAVARPSEHLLGSGTHMAERK